MEKYLYTEFYNNEEIHWWHRSAREIQLYFVKKYLRTKKPSILDIGCGTGSTLRQLSKLGKVIGIDFSQEAINYCNKRGLKNVTLGDATRLRFRSKSFDCVTVFDVIEHIDEDLKAFKEIKRVLKSGGIAIFTMPAFMFLWDNHDVVNQHYRRYSMQELKNKLQFTSFEIVYTSYMNFFLFPVVVFVKFFNKLIGRKGQFNVQIVKEPFNSILYRIFSLEKHFLPHVKFPFGVSIICVVKRK